MVIVIDNYDSFTYNIVDYLKQLSANVNVIKNDSVTIQELQNLRPKYVVVSPGPHSPERAGISVEVIRKLGHTIPTLGICLGHQAIGYAFGATIAKATKPMHGMQSKLYHDGRTIFNQIPYPYTIGRYHSLIVDRLNLPEELEISAYSEDGEIMAIRHKIYPIEGIQFHPESFLSGYGLQLLNNFMEYYA
ncbi:anthranilate synthase component II [Paenibacillus agilis]|uniref:Aminodeoxychorismate/anthranilate synthase component II n=1 Tax=Paenibacillus agilis TaxID=3020863 RepID=A0A559J0Z3_9BACL|nr:aminodeoxychorismate/anthranilate synthase component II [Paenibacillus agilis]TVX93558.1 aminodeoxychorismate/anthranilate synthase component II [Paenibacillus agilis]